MESRQWWWWRRLLDGKHGWDLGGFEKERVVLGSDLGRRR